MHKIERTLQQAVNTEGGQGKERVGVGSGQEMMRDGIRTDTVGRQNIPVLKTARAEEWSWLGRPQKVPEAGRTLTGAGRRECI